MKTAIYKCAKCGQAIRHDTTDGQAINWYCYQCDGTTAFKRVRGTTFDSIRRVFMPLHEKSFVVDEWASEQDMRANLRHFFDVAHGRRETFTVHRGCIIVRNTVKYSVSPYQERRTTIYLYGHWERSKRQDVACISPRIRLGSVREAKRFLDRILDKGRLDETASA